VNKYLHTVASVGFLFTLNYDARNHELKKMDTFSSLNTCPTFLAFFIVNIRPPLLFEGVLSSLRCLLDRLPAFRKVSLAVGAAPFLTLGLQAFMLGCAPPADRAQR